MIEGNARLQVFLSYSHEEADQRCVKRLRRDLLANGINVWVDEDRIAPGSPNWEIEVRKGIQESDAVIYAASPAACASDYVHGELNIADNLYRRTIYPVWILGDNWGEAAPLKFQKAQYIDIRQEEDYAQGLQQLIQTLREQTPSPLPSVAPPGEPRDPYKGLKPFTVGDAHDFFGRDTLVQAMLHEIERVLLDEQQHRQGSRLLTVIGASGSGKSSVVMAGLISRLQDGEDILGHKHWICLEPTRPGEHPLDSLAETLSSYIQDKSREDVRQELRGESRLALYQLTKTIAAQKRGRVVLLLDQFEELFTETVEQSERQRYINLLVNAATERHSQLIIIVTLRADFYDHPMHYPDLHELMQTHRVEVPSMTVQQLREAIECPARLLDVQITYEGDLVGDLLFEMQGQENALPLLQFTLKQLFDHRNGHLLTLQAYHGMGGVRGALDGHAEATYSNLPTDGHRRFARSLFLRLINPGGVEQEATRRRVSFKDLALFDATQGTIMQETIDTFVQARLLTASTVAGVHTLEISHEALISAWERLKNWITTAREDIHFQQELQHDIERWQQEGRPEQRLYGGTRYQDALAWARGNVLNWGEAEFLYLSKLWVRRRKEMRWQLLALIPVILLVLAVLAPALSPYFSLPNPTIVTNLQDDGPGSLRQVIRKASPTSTITFAPTLHGTVLLTSSDLNITTHDITLDGSDPNRITISSAAHGYKIHILSGSSVSFENLSFKGSITQSTAFIYNEGTLTLNNCIITGNTSDYNGGGLSNWGGTLTLNKSIVSHNQASGNGAGIFNWNGLLTLNNSTVSGNIASNNGGGTYSLRGGLVLNHSIVADNQAVYDGGGISILNGELFLTDSSQILSNTAVGNGGGLAIVGSRAIMSNSTITHNQADQQGGGLVVERDSENNTSSQVTLTNTEVTDHPKTAYYIGENYVGTVPGHLDTHIARLTVLSSTTLQIVSTDTAAVTGSPPPKRPPEYSPHYRGTVDINAFCQAERYSYGALTETSDTRSGASVVITCESLSGNQSRNFALQTTCQWEYPQYKSDIVDRLANFYDPSSLQCYSHVTRLGDIATIPTLQAFCQSAGAAGGIKLDGTNAYSWKCKPRSGVPIGFSVADACQWYYHNPNAFDRLVAFSAPSGWECWAAA